MEVVVPCCVGVLVASGLYGVLQCAGAEERTGRSAREAAAEARAAALRAMAAIGALLLDAGVPSRHVLQVLADELRGLSVRGHAVFAGLDEARSLGVLVVASCAACAGAGVLSWSPLGALIGLVAPTAALWGRSLARARATKAKVDEAMPEAFASLAISLGSGLSLNQAMRYVGSHSEEPVRSEFMRVSFAMSCGVSAAEALDDMVERLSAPGLELVSLALKISQRTGAPLKDLLAEASQLAGDRIELARRLDVKTSQARMSAQLVAAMPVAMVAFLSLFSSDFRRGLATFTGAVSVCIALLLNATAWVIIRHIMKVDLS